MDINVGDNVFLGSNEQVCFTVYTKVIIPSREMVVRFACYPKKIGIS